MMDNPKQIDVGRKKLAELKNIIAIFSKEVVPLYEDGLKTSEQKYWSTEEDISDSQKCVDVVENRHKMLTQWLDEATAQSEAASIEMENGRKKLRKIETTLQATENKLNDTQREVIELTNRLSGQQKQLDLQTSQLRQTTEDMWKRKLLSLRLELYERETGVHIENADGFQCNADESIQPLLSGYALPNNLDRAKLKTFYLNTTDHSDVYIENYLKNLLNDMNVSR